MFLRSEVNVHIYIYIYAGCYGNKVLRQLKKGEQKRSREKWKEKTYIEESLNFKSQVNVCSLLEGILKYCRSTLEPSTRLEIEDKTKSKKQTKENISNIYIPIVAICWFIPADTLFIKVLSYGQFCNCVFSCFYLFFCHLLFFFKQKRVAHQNNCQNALSLLKNQWNCVHGVNE